MSGSPTYGGTLGSFSLTYGGGIVSTATNEPAPANALSGFYTFAVYRQGTWYDLSDYNIMSTSRFLLLEEGGVGMPDVEYASERGPEQHGETLLNFHLQPRTIDLVIGVLGANVQDYYDRRKLLTSIFAPSRTPIYLRWTLPNGDVRQIDGYIVPGLDLGSSERPSPLYTATAVSIRCPDPTFYTPFARVVNIALTSGEDSGTIPTPIPTGIGASKINQTNTITYEGTWRDYPLITVYGPASDLVITNTTTGDKLDFTGWTIGVGAAYIIDLRYGYKTVEEWDLFGHFIASRIDKLVQGSSIETFYLASTTEVDDGVNSIRVQASGVTTATDINIQWYDRYLGW